MGNPLSVHSARERNGASENLDETKMDDGNDKLSESDNSDVSDKEARAKAKEKDMEEFQKELDVKREQRKEILARRKAEKQELLNNIQNEKDKNITLSNTNKSLRKLLENNNIEIPNDLKPSEEDSEMMLALKALQEEFQNIKDNNNKLRMDLVESNSSLQNAYSDIADLNGQNTESMKQINALKEAVAVSKTMLKIREKQLNDLKEKLKEIERGLAEREASMLSSNLRMEYEKQLENIRSLRALYEERARISEVTKQHLVRELQEYKVLHQAETTKNEKLSETIESLEKKEADLIETNENQKDEISSYKEENRIIKAEMSVVNKLFSQVLLGYKTKQDLDKLIHRLEENHGILTHMAEKENDSEASTALPKLLLELVSQVDENNEDSCENPLADEVLEEQPASTSATEIVQNLPKVWRVLMELLSHQAEPDTAEEKVTTCYKSVDTLSGPVLVPSVSQTYIRLKDLIVEKLTLIKEVNRMKQLNCHLESRLGVQEKRLCLVTTELSKTWHVVSKLRRHHQQLHTHEKILKYELQQKRKLLNELKEELEYCREKWEQAREKNTQSEKDWKKLRAEFSSRHTKSDSPLNNSGESGYSDERPSEDSSGSNDESECITDSKQVKGKKRFKKSFETILDSSGDCNLIAEREDPASDMLDVAELPLDVHDSGDQQETSTSTEKNQKLCEETEDEAGDMAIDSSIDENINNEEYVTTESNIDNMTARSSEDTESRLISKNAISFETSDPSSSVSTDPKTILENIKRQNERLALKDKRLNDLEQGCSKVVTDLTNTLNVADAIMIKLDCRSSENFSVIKSSIEDDFNNMPSCSTSTIHREAKVESSSIVHDTELNESMLAHEHKTETQTNDTNIKDLSQTLNKGDINEDNVPCISTIETELVTENGDESDNSVLPGDHEARFAARDLRLKNLEEQTKSLVTKVNKTKSKGVKINYKLDELHNLYGSESSRAGTPLEDTEDNNEQQKSDDSSDE